MNEVRNFVRHLVVDLPPGQRQLQIPTGFLLQGARRAGTELKLEVLTIEDSGNKTITEGELKTLRKCPAFQQSQSGPEGTVNAFNSLAVPLTNFRIVAEEVIRAVCGERGQAMKNLKIPLPTSLALLLVACAPNESAGRTAANSQASPAAQIVAFPSGALELHGLLYRPEGAGPFPAVLYNHGSAAGLLNNQAFDAIAPIFVEHGWAFFAPYRRGQGLSEAAGPYIMDEIAAARRRGGLPEADRTMTRLLSTEHLGDQLAAFAWLHAQPFIQPDAIAVMGNSFGGIESLLGATRADYCAAVDAAGGSESWDEAPALRDLLTQAAQAAPTPTLFFQAENDFSLVPSQTLHAIRQQSGLPSELRIYPAFGRSQRDGHSFPYRGASVWSADVLGFLELHCAR